MPADLRKARELFLYAVGKLPAEQWDDYVAGACGDDAELAQRVRHFLQVHREAGSFLESPIVGPIDSGQPAEGSWGILPSSECPLPTMPERPGAMIGPYKLLEQIGEGGFGVVFMAEQTEPVRRKVALKILKPGMDTRQVVARFEAERQALAIMDHPNIAKVLDGGSTRQGDKETRRKGEKAASGNSCVPVSLSPGLPVSLSDPGRPYFVMELVNGIPITKFCDERRLTPKERLVLFVPVCQAVQHAHQKGIIHRDLKPSNVLVALHDDKPVPKIIDFGVAKATGPKLTDKTLCTEFGSVVGTLEYMSPEQAELNQLDIDTRSDIYSLGVLLYELLTGTTPLERVRVKDSSILEVLRIIREEEPPRPSTRLSATAGLPSIAANRNLEPQKLRGVIRGELDWIVMKALEKDRGRRYQSANGLARDIEHYLHDDPVDACPPSTGYRLRKYAWRHKGALTMAAVLAAAVLLTLGTIAGSLGWVLRDKDARRARADDAVQTALREVRTLQTDRKWREALAGIQRVEELLVPMEGSLELQEAVRELRRDLQMVGTLEEIRSRQVDVNKQGVRDFTPVDAAYAQAFRDYGTDCEALEAAVAGERLRGRVIAVDLAISLDEWAGFQRALRKHDGKGWKHLLAVARVADPDTWRVRLRDALELNQPEVLKTLANSEEMPTMPLRTLHRLGKSLADIKEWDEAARLLLKVQRLYPNDFWTNSMLAWTLDQVKPPQSVAAARFATVAAALRNDNQALQSNLGYYLEKIGELDHAVAAYRRAMELYPGHLDTCANLNRILARQGATETAIAIFQQAVARQPDLAELHYYLASALRKKGDLDGALASLRRVLDLKPTFAAARLELISVLVKQGKDTEVVAVYRDAVGAYEDAIRREPANFQAQSGLAWMLTTCPARSIRDPHRALQAARKAVELDPKSEVAWQVLGWAHYRSGNWKASIEALEKSNALQNSPEGGDAWQWFFLAMAHWQLGNQEQARVWYERAAKWRGQNAPDHEEAQRFQAEAAALLKIEEEPKTR